MASKVVPRTRLGSQGLQVSKQGLGCMGMSAFYGPPKPEADMIALIRHAVDSGVTFLDTSDVYGPFHNEILLGKALKGIRDKVQLATKFGATFSEDGTMKVCGHPAYVRSACEASLKRLDVDYIDLYYLHRIDTTVPIEVTVTIVEWRANLGRHSPFYISVGEMKKLVEEGKVKYIGLSEASASTIRRAHAVHPITAVQIEWSLWTRDMEEEMVATCGELGIGIVAFNPEGRGVFSMGAEFVEDGDDTDFRKAGQPMFLKDNLDKNERLFVDLHQRATTKGCTIGQLALAWLQHQGDDVVPIPGTTRMKDFEENVGAVHVSFSKEEIDEISALFPADTSGGTSANSDTPPLSSWKASQK